MSFTSRSLAPVWLVTFALSAGRRGHLRPCEAVRDNVADAVGRGAREVEHFAMASKSASAARRS